MQVRFDDAVVVVTGGGSGIGAAVARGFAGAGATVAIHYHHSEEGARAVAREVEQAGGRAHVAQADLTDPAAVTAMFDQIIAAFGRVDVLVNNAGGLIERAPVDATPDGLYEQMMALNFGSAFVACGAVLPVMKRQQSGAIINISSIAARNGGGNGSSLYCAGKGALSAFTRALAKEVAADGIRVNAISPGIIDTAFHSKTAPEAFASMVAAIPLGRPGQPEELVGPSLFLASAQLSSFVTGHVLEVNGGHVMG